MDQTTQRATHSGLMDFRAWLHELERTGHLVRIDDEIDPQTEAGAIMRLANERQSPAQWFTNCKGAMKGATLLGGPFVGAVVRVLGPLALLPGALACALAGRLRAIGLCGVLWTRPEGPAAAAASALCDHHAHRSSLRSSRQCGAVAGLRWLATHGAEGAKD